MKARAVKWAALACAARWSEGLVGREEEKGRRIASKLGGLVLGLATGAGLMYFLDPDSGGRRRAWVRDKLVKGGHEVEAFAEAKTEHYEGGAEGVVAETKARVKEADVDDETLAARVRPEHEGRGSVPGLQT